MSAPLSVAALHEQPIALVAAVTGGGVSLASDLLTVPGGSRTVLEVSVPYSTEALAGFLGRVPDRFCSGPTALAMAAAAWQRARRLLRPGDDRFAIGLGITAALRSDRPKRGDHRAHVAVQSLGGTSLHSLTLAKGQRSRVEEDRLVSRVSLEAVHRFLSPDPTAHPDGLRDDDRFAATARAFPDDVAAMLDGVLDHAVLPAGDRPDWPAGDRPDWPAGDRPDWIGLLPGSFNPRHRGHERLRDAAAAHLGGAVGYELTLSNADKPPLDAITLHDRLRPFDEPVLITQAATFTEKARIHPGVFVVGVDTAERVLQPRFYGGTAGRDASLAELAALGGRFLVADRLDGDSLKSLDDLDVGRFGTLFERLPNFREDISSTELRSTEIRGAGET